MILSRNSVFLPQLGSCLTVSTRQSCKFAFSPLLKWFLWLHITLNIYCTFLQELYFFTLVPTQAQAPSKFLQNQKFSTAEFKKKMEIIKYIYLGFVLCRKIVLK